MDQFIKIPLKLLKDEEYSDLSLEAICLHALLLDRLESSKRKGDQFKDENGAFYAVMSRDEIVDVLRIGKNKVPKIKKELIDHGLLEERSRGSRATLYYPQKLKTESGNVGLHALTKADELSTETGRHDVPRSDYSPPVMYQNRATWSTETGRHDVPKSDTNQTNYNQTNNNHTTSLTQDNL
ncbi:replication initiator protein A, partial [Streptococcus danieliae]|nr:replication initiator protein A [Streptococcus danieliae]